MDNNKSFYEYKNAKIIYFKKTESKYYLIEKKKNVQISLLSRNISIFNAKTGIKLFSKDN